MGLAKKMRRKPVRGKPKHGGQRHMTRDEALNAFCINNRLEGDMRDQAETDFRVIFFTALRKTYPGKYGKRAYDRIIERANDLKHYTTTKEQFQMLADETHISFDGTHRAKKDRYGSIVDETVDENTALFLSALRDEYGFSEKKLGTVYHECANLVGTFKHGIANEMETGCKLIDGWQDDLEKIGIYIEEPKKRVRRSAAY